MSTELFRLNIFSLTLQNWKIQIQAKEYICHHEWFCACRNYFHFFTLNIFSWRLLWWSQAVTGFRSFYCFIVYLSVWNICGSWIYINQTTQAVSHGLQRTVCSASCWSLGLLLPTALLSCCIAATPAFFLTLEAHWAFSYSGPLYFLFPLPGMLFPDFSCVRLVLICWVSQALPHSAWLSWDLHVVPPSYLPTDAYTSQLIILFPISLFIDDH